MAETAGRASDRIFERPAELLRALIRFDTTNPPGREAACVQYVHGLLAAAGIEARLLARDPARPNLVARLPGRGDAPPLLLYGHVDVVSTADQAWRHPPFAGVIADGYVWGRGAVDMKGGVAMMLAAVLRAKAEAVSLPGDVVLAVLSDEEGVGEYGARYLVEGHPDLFAGVRYAIGEFGGFTLHVGGGRLYPIQVAERRSGMVRATLRGPSGHANLPLRGGTMAQLGDLLIRLDRRRLPAHVTPVTRRFVEATAAALPPATGAVVRQLVDPTRADAALGQLDALGASSLAQLCEPMLRHTVNATVVRGAGPDVGAIPGEVVVEMAVTALPGFGPDDVLAELREVLGDSLELEVHLGEPGPAEPDMGLFDTLAAILGEADPGGVPVPWVMPAVTDGRFFARLGIQTYGFLPLHLPEGFDFARTIHAADERVPVDALAFGADAVFRALQRFGEAAGAG